MSPGLYCSSLQLSQLPKFVGFFFSWTVFSHLIWLPKEWASFLTVGIQNCPGAPIQLTGLGNAGLIMVRGLWAKSSQLSDFVNTGVLEHNHSHSLSVYAAFMLLWQSGVVTTETHTTESLQYLLSGP